MKILLNALSDNPDYNADCDCAVVDLTPDLLEQVCCRVEMARQMLAQDSNLYELYFWGGTADFFSYRLVEACEAAAPAEWSVNRERTGHGELPGSVDLSAHEIRRTECDQMIVRCPFTPGRSEFEIAWVAIPKHTDIYVTTEAITLEDMTRYAGIRSDESPPEKRREVGRADP